MGVVPRQSNESLVRASQAQAEREHHRRDACATGGNDAPMPAPFARVGEVQALGWHRVGEPGLVRTAELVTLLPVVRPGHGGDVAVVVQLVSQGDGRPEHEAELMRLDLSPQQARSLAMALEDAADEAGRVALGSGLVDVVGVAKGGC